MTFATLNTYQQAPDQAFEALCNQLFERWVYATHPNQVRRFAIVNGAGGDGGVEAYANLANGETIGLQAKWFREPLQSGQLKQIRESVDMARRVRPHLRRYIVCVPRDFQSIKIGRDGQPIKNSEDERVQTLLADIHTTYPDLTVEFWTEHVLLGKLQQPENEGVARFWFQKEVFSPTILSRRFSLAKESWLRERYSPTLHAYGILQQAVDELLATPTQRDVASREVEQTAVRLYEVTHLLENFSVRAGAGVSAALGTELAVLRTTLEDYATHLHQLAQTILNVEASWDSPTLPPLNLPIVEEQLAVGRFSNQVRGILPLLQAALEQLANQDVAMYSQKLSLNYQSHNLLVFGKPATGKTHGLARAVEGRLEQGYPALIISARHTPASNWQTILSHVLGGLSDWSDEQLFSALEALAVRADGQRARASVPHQTVPDEPTRVLIGIDGVDEATDPAAWRDRVNELRVWLVQYPRLRFVVTSRAYPPANLNPCGLVADNINQRLDLPSDGDVSLPDLAGRYLQHYGVIYSTMPWLLDAFQDALAVRLFALQYRDVDLATLSEPVSVSLFDLLKYRVTQIEQEFAHNSHLKFSVADCLGYSGLLSVVKALQLESELPQGTLCQQLLTDLGGWVTLNQATRMLEGYADHGLILVRDAATSSRLLPPVKLVSLAFQQPLVDYLLACQATEEIIQSGSRLLPAGLLLRNDLNAYYLTAIALLNDHHILIGEDGYWINQIPVEQLEDIQYTALANAASSAVALYLPQATARFREGGRARNVILESFIVPNAYRKDLEVVRPVVHEVLSTFSSVFDRDLFWSGPAAYDQAPEENIGELLRHYELHDYDHATGLPLLFAWSLATVNNTYREYAREQLARWGQANQEGLLELLALVFPAGDPQVQEDLALVLLGVSSLSTQASAGGQQLAQWVLANIFVPSHITEQLNSVVRAAARACIERAVVLGNCSETEAATARPPYLTNADLLPLALDTTNETVGHRGERFPIVHDLAWYVLDDSYNGFLELPRAWADPEDTQGYELLAQYEQVYKVPVNTYEFAMSAALAYIASLGYNRTIGPGTTKATHGSLSETSTFEEKYTWLAVHHLQGHLADRVPFEQHGQQYPYVPDYRLFLHLPNPATELKGIVTNEAQWYVPVDISPELPTGSSADLVIRAKAWVSQEDEPDFATWLTLPDLVPAAVSPSTALRPWLPLFLSLQLSEREGLVSNRLEITCILLPEADWQAIQHSHDGNLRQLAADNLWEFEDVDRWQARPSGTTYASVKDVVLGSSPGENGTTTELYGPAGQEWLGYATVTNVTEQTLEDGETHYLLPSQLVRQYLGITDTNRQAFRTKDGQIVACYQEINEDFEATQELLVVDRQLLMEATALHQLRPCWLVSQFRHNTTLFTKQFPNEYARCLRQWLVWEDDRLHAQLFYHYSYQGAKEGVRVESKMAAESET